MADEPADAADAALEGEDEELTDDDLVVEGDAPRLTLY
jgi:hypothetical protein